MALKTFDDCLGRSPDTRLRTIFIDPERPKERDPSFHVLWCIGLSNLSWIQDISLIVLSISDEV